MIYYLYYNQRFYDNGGINMEFTRGMRDKLSKYVDINREFDVILGIETCK